MAIYDNDRDVSNDDLARRMVADTPRESSPILMLIIVAALVGAGWFGYEAYRGSDIGSRPEISAPISTPVTPTDPTTTAKPVTPTAPTNP